jgi:hypothetical protein
MTIDIYEEAAKAKDKEVDAAIEMMADQERWREKEMEKRRQDQEDLDKRLQIWRPHSRHRELEPKQIEWVTDARGLDMYRWR